MRQDNTRLSRKPLKKEKRKEKISFNLTCWLAVVQSQRHKHETWQTIKEASSVPLLLRLCPSFHTFTHFTLFSFTQSLPLYLYPYSFSLLLPSTLFSQCDCASTLFFYLLFLVLLVLKSSDQSFSFSAFMLRCSTLHCSAFSLLCLSPPTGHTV